MPTGHKLGSKEPWKVLYTFWINIVCRQINLADSQNIPCWVSSSHSIDFFPYNFIMEINGHLEYYVPRMLHMCSKASKFFCFGGYPCMLNECNLRLHPKWSSWVSPFLIILKHARKHTLSALSWLSYLSPWTFPPGISLPTSCLYQPLLSFLHSEALQVGTRTLLFFPESIITT